MKWATRPGVHVDRAACAWLIRRFIDPDAEFVFPADLAAIPAGATPFDMRGAALGHHQGRCSFETALEAFGLDDDPALEEIGHIIHEADLADERYDAPAAAGLDVLIRGLTLTSESDHDTLAITSRLFDGLYEHTRRQLMAGRPHKQPACVRPAREGQWLQPSAATYCWGTSGTASPHQGC
jgi:hypothetical protein